MLECCVCLENNVRPNAKTPCGHCVCRDCLSKLLQPTCPICRQKLEIKINNQLSEKMQHDMQMIFNSPLDVQDLMFDFLSKEVEIPDYMLRFNYSLLWYENWKQERRLERDEKIARMFDGGYIPKAERR